MTKKPGRNDPCPCGSGKKYKNCCWGKESKKTYTSSGKRKFKAKVLSSGGMSGLFPPPTPQSPAPSQTLKDRNVQAPGGETPPPPAFEPTKEDFRVDEENES